MKKMILIGRTGVGKTSFCQAINDLKHNPLKTQTIQIINNTIDTPGEYAEIRTLYRALIVTAVDADLIVLMQDCTDDQSIFAPGFSSMFGKPSIGLVTKTDLAENQKMIRAAEEKLTLAGCGRIFHVSNTKRTGMEDIKAYLEMQSYVTIKEIAADYMLQIYRNRAWRKSHALFLLQYE